MSRLHATARSGRRDGCRARARPRGRCARTSPRACRAHSRRRRRKPQRARARRACSSASRNCVHGLERPRGQRARTLCWCRDVEHPQHGVVSPGDVVRASPHLIEHRVLAGCIDEHCEASGRSEGRAPTRRPCGARREPADAVANVASARDREDWTPWRMSRAAARSVCSHLPSDLPGAFAETSSRTATCACSATVLASSRNCVQGLERPRGQRARTLCWCRERRTPQHGIVSPGDVVRASPHLIGHRVLAARIDDHCRTSGRSEGRAPTRRPCGARREPADAVAIVASARDREDWTPWRMSRAAARSVCSHLPSDLPGAFAETSSRTATCACSATVLASSRNCVHGLERPRGQRARTLCWCRERRTPQHGIVSPGDLVRASPHLIGHRVLAARIDDHCRTSGRSEGRAPTRRPCGARREPPDAVADVASARGHEHRALAGRIDDDCEASGRSEGRASTRRPCGARREPPDAVTEVASARGHEHRALAGRIDDDCEASGRSEGTAPTRRPCGARREPADAVANVASAQDLEHRALAARIDELREASGRSEGTAPTRRPCGARREPADAVADVAPARDRKVGVLAPPLEPAGRIRGDVLANRNVRALGDRARLLTRLQAMMPSTSSPGWTWLMLRRARRLKPGAPMRRCDASPSGSTSPRSGWAHSRTRDRNPRRASARRPGLTSRESDTGAR
jgi:hypothetical protein